MTTPLTTRDADGISGRDWMDRAREAVDTYKQMRSSDHVPATRTVESFHLDAKDAVTHAWRHPEAAKAMQASGFSERGMQDELKAGKSAKVIEGLSAPDLARPQDAAQTRRDNVRQAADAYRANLIAAAPQLPAKPAQSETQKRRSGLRM